ncbi:deoxyribodipyrimidine photo-lyase [Mesorhizobium loti]|uniref:Photolyase/cryptochrome alpha/beta domain-containing protein n=1 Tax=Mesorhizobium loti R88b TaxID=935548 RepID=A0A6M7WUF4_RHILI|nr:deoxyribodipyrimidine photo-lyase [Mesorhizobium loti]QKD03508.1 hypothetical protein EB235_20075 [Mesorhizobium loti R88b]
MALRQATDANDSRPIIVLFRNDLRILNNRTLSSAVDAGSPLILLFILDEGLQDSRLAGEARRGWLHRSPPRPAISASLLWTALETASFCRAKRNH